MSKFNVGDEIIRTGSSLASEGVVRGERYTVYDEEHGNWGQRVKVGTFPGYWYDSANFELAPIGGPDDSAVNHPAHYNSHPSGVECIEVARHHNFNIGNVFKYLWRLGLKGQDAGSKEKRLEEIDKAIFYLKDERKRIEDER